MDMSKFNELSEERQALIEEMCDEHTTEEERERLAELDNFSLLDERLAYEGICGFTQDILDYIEVVYGVKVQDYD